MAYTFNGVANTITLSAGMVVLDLVDLHSRWKDWVFAGNAGFAQAFKTVGGDIPAIPLYLFLLNGWRIVPQSANHTLSVVNGILEVDGGGEPFLDPAGSYAIRINRQAPGIAIGYSTTGGTAGPSAESIAAAVRVNLSADLDRLTEAWARLGLDPSRPVVQNDTQISFGSVLLALSEAGGAVTVARQ